MEITRPLAGFRTLLTATSPDGRQRRAGRRPATAGREELVLAFSYDVDSTQLQVLAPGLVAWLTRGVHLGFDRSYLAVHVDDVLLPNVRWVPGVHCTPGADCPPGVPAPPLIRMTADDVAYAVDWQRRTGFRLDLVFNGAGSVAADAGAGTDPLTAAWSRRGPSSAGSTTPGPTSTWAACGTCRRRRGRAPGCRSWAGPAA